MPFKLENKIPIFFKCILKISFNAVVIWASTTSIASLENISTYRWYWFKSSDFLKQKEKKKIIWYAYKWWNIWGCWEEHTESKMFLKFPDTRFQIKYYHFLIFLKLFSSIIKFWFFQDLQFSQVARIPYLKWLLGILKFKTTKSSTINSAIIHFVPPPPKKKKQSPSCIEWMQKNPNVMQ